MDDRTFSKEATIFLMENDHKSEWISTVKIILKKFGLESHFEQPSAITHEKLKELLSKRLHDNFRNGQRLFCPRQEVFDFVYPLKKSSGEKSIWILSTAAN